jgi:hypothetical protein
MNGYNIGPLVHGCYDIGPLVHGCYNIGPLVHGCYNIGRTFYFLSGHCCYFYKTSLKSDTR